MRDFQLVVTIVLKTVSKGRKGDGSRINFL